MLRLSWLVRVFVSACLLLISTSFCLGQVTNVTADQQAPIPGAGHDYIHMLTETVNPANGSLSVRIQVPIPKGRGLTLPFAFAYDSNGMHYPDNTHGQQGWATDSRPGYEQGGWRYTAPYLNSQIISISSPACSYFVSYMLLTPSGGRHALYLSAWQPNGHCSTNPHAPPQYLTGGNDYFQATSAPNNAVTAASADGTVYRFPGAYGFASSVEDRNGNEITISATQGAPYGFTMTDTAGRAVVSASSFGASGGDTVRVSGLSTPYTVHWGTASYNYTPGWVLASTDGACPNMVYANGNTPVVTSLTLPNGQSYQFHYDSTYGLVDEIIFPSGGWVKYT